MVSVSVDGVDGISFIPRKVYNSIGSDENTKQQNTESKSQQSIGYELAAMDDVDS